MFYDYQIEPFVRMLVDLDLCVSPRMLLLDDGTIETLAPLEPEWVTAQKAEIVKIIETIQEQVLKAYGLPFEK